MKNYRVGIVIPVFLTKFISTTIEYINTTVNNDEAVFCIVNDGVPEVKDYLETLSLPDNMYVVNLEENRCFSGSNNSGFKSLLEKYPSLEYIGSLNDDTIPKTNWLQALVETLDKHPEVSVVTPQLKSIDPISGDELHTFSIFTYGPGCQMICPVNYITEDAYTKLFCGFCFLCRVEPFKNVEFLDEGYKNGAEDVDLSLKFLTKGYKMMVSANSHVVHFGGSSRNTRPNIGSEISQSINLLFTKWGFDLRKYNNY